MKILPYIILLLSATFTFSQVGINTTNPTAQLDVNGDIRVRGLSNMAGNGMYLHAQPDGTLVTQLTASGVSGLKFVGALDADLALNLDASFKEIILKTELVDIANEYDTTTGRFIPIENGFYKINMNFDIGNYTNSNIDLDILIGLWDFTNNRWVLRRTFKHRNSNNGTTAKTESLGITNYLQLTAGVSYGFRLLADYDNTISPAPLRDASLMKNNTNATGSTLSTNFAIERVL